METHVGFWNKQTNCKDSAVALVISSELIGIVSFVESWPRLCLSASQSPI